MGGVGRPWQQFSAIQGLHDMRYLDRKSSTHKCNKYTLSSRFPCLLACQPPLSPACVLVARTHALTLRYDTSASPLSSPVSLSLRSHGHTQWHGGAGWRRYSVITALHTSASVKSCRGKPAAVYGRNHKGGVCVCVCVCVYKYQPEPNQAK